MHEFKKSQEHIHGTAIFMALLIIAIVATITVLLMRVQQINIRRTQMLVTSEQAYLYAQSVIDWAKIQLMQDLQNPVPNTDWPIKMKPTNLPDGQGKVAAILLDAEGLFNLNNFTTSNQSQSSNDAESATGSNTNSAQANPANNNQAITDENAAANASASASETKNKTSSSGSSAAANAEKNRMILSNLLDALRIEVSAEQKQNLLNGLVGWTTSADPTGNTLDAFDQQYSRLNPPYRSPHAPMTSVSELRMVQGMTPQIYNALLPYIVALPENTAINTNHAPPLILQAMGLNEESQNASASATGQNQASSKYFLLRADVFIQDQHLVLYGLLFRKLDSQNPKSPQINLLWQSFGTV